MGFKTLWITHTIDLLNQSYNRAKNNFESVGLGKIANGRIQIGTHITFATVQTLSKIDLQEYADEWDCIVVDECHRICGTPASAGMFYKVINKLIARYEDTDRIISTFNADNAVSQTFLIEGIRGSGKTVLMTTVAKKLEEEKDWIVINLNPTMDLLSNFAIFDVFVL